MWCWDFWFAKQSDAYHAFYLEAPFCLGDPQRMHGNQHVGHATSPDLIHWTNQGPAAVPILGTWNDLSI
ncbi:MAG: glycosyl hydrolase family 32, partial [Armatimonadetes bacterium]|nr:glycosyl hydrolase family 32 [Armatimonadota bacterium]NDK13382.1 glycosyl hydrolase family 32 [Armatimonadota bacterium]